MCTAVLLDDVTVDAALMKSIRGDGGDAMAMWCPLMFRTAFRVLRAADRTPALGRHGFAVLFVRFRRDVWDQPHTLHTIWSIYNCCLVTNVPCVSNEEML
jgi:hypothetical protein